MRVKNFEKFQHFKDRRPPWVKLYRDILDDAEWFELDPLAAKVLVMLWLIASEDETKQGVLPSTKQLAFRLRMTENTVKKVCIGLSHWLEQTDNSSVSDCYQTDAPERAGEETETETETDSCAEQAQRGSLMDRFEDFYSAYPKKRNRGDAEKAWKAIKPDAELTKAIVEAVEVAKHRDDWRKEGGQFVPYPASWLRASGWLDSMPSEPASTAVYVMPDFMRGAR